MLAGLEHGPAVAMHSVIPKTAMPAPPARIGTLQGRRRARATEREYTLTADTTIIGKADTAQVRLKGWFKPKVAAAIARKGDGFTVTPIGGKVKINGQTLSAATICRTAT